MITIKRGTIIASLQDESILEPAMALDKICHEKGWGHATITGGIDGNHLYNSQHYKGTAIDLRLPSHKTGDTNHDAMAILDLRKALPQWSVILEKDHIHVQR